MSAPKSLSPTLAEYASRVEKIRTRFATLLTSPPESVRQKPDPKSWSVGEIADHLVKTHDLYRKRAIALIDKLPASAADDETVRPGWFAKKFIGFIHPDNTKPLKAPSAFRPAVGVHGPEAIETFLEKLEEFRGFVEASSGKPLNSKKLAAPFPLPIIRFTLGEFLEIQVLHMERHTGQAERTIERVRSGNDS